MKPGSLLVEALIAILITSLAIGVSMVSSYNLLKKVYENRIILNMLELLINKCEEISTLNQTQIFENTQSITYKGQQYTISVKKVSTDLSSNFKYFNYNQSSNTYTSVSKPPNIKTNPVTVVVIRVTDSKGRYLETQVVPQQW
ncbi:MAG: hypothetical protein ACP5KD_04840 [Fervidobacterium sp.]